MINEPLYTVSSRYLQALEQLMGFEFIEYPAFEEAVENTLSALEDDVKEKAIQVASIIKNMEADAKAVDHAISKLKQRKEKLERNKQSLNSYLAYHLEQTGVTKIRHSLFDITIKKNPGSVVVQREESIPNEFLTDVITKKINKVAIRQVLLGGYIVPGVILDRKSRVDIK